MKERQIRMVEIIAQTPGKPSTAPQGGNAIKKRRGRPPVTHNGIGIGQDWKVSADALNVSLSRRIQSRKGKADRWETIGWYSTLGNALVGLVRQGIRDTELAGVQAVQDKITQLEHDILKMAAGK